MSFTPFKATTTNPSGAFCRHTGSSSFSSTPSPGSNTRRSPRSTRCTAKLPRQPDVFEVKDISPPPQSLGLHTLPPNTHNGDEIEVEGDSYVVQKVVFRYKLIKGRYRPEYRRLEVRRTGRFLYNKFLENIYRLDASNTTN